MRFKEYLNELFKTPVDIKITTDVWNKWQASFNVANDVYTVTGTLLHLSVLLDTFTDKELKKFTGITMKDVEKERKKLKARHEKRKEDIAAGKKVGIMIPSINTLMDQLGRYFADNEIWIIGFGSKKFGDKILDIRTKKEVLIIYSGVKKAVEEFMKKKKPSFLIVDAKDPKRLSIYKRFVDEIVKRGGYKIIGGKRKIKWKTEEGQLDHKTTGWVLHK